MISDMLLRLCTDRDQEAGYMFAVATILCIVVLHTHNLCKKTKGILQKMPFCFIKHEDHPCVSEGLPLHCPQGFMSEFSGDGTIYLSHKKYRAKV